ncbi:MAG: toprim domain-containing protein [Chloroflexi bacterium]|nr:toprim domain-containing protein [Chloroflexota bacterium]OJV91118.1 MAG: hypothetical protein BGO39_26375 [Chloroflexi bacterium 54-19]
MSVRDLHKFNSPPPGVSNTNLTLTALELDACRPIRAGGNTYRAFCPFHGSDHQRSLRLNGDTGHFNCFACGAWGYTEEARERWKEQLQNNSPLDLKPQTARVPHSPARTSYPQTTKNPSPASAHATSNPRPPLRVVTFAAPPIVKRETASASPYLGQLLEKYQAALPGSWGEEYLKRRKIPLELARRYGVGYAPPGQWAHTARDWKFGRLVFPHTDPGGHILNLYGRAVGSNEKVPKQLRHDHLQGEKGYFNGSALGPTQGPDMAEGAGLQPESGSESHRTLKLVRLDGQNNGLQNLASGSEVVRLDGQEAVEEGVFICEGPFDALSLLAAGKDRVIAIFGVNGWRWEWARNITSLVFALDADETGQTSWRDLARQARLRGKRVAFLPPEAYGEAKDVNEAWINGTLLTYLGTNVTGPAQPPTDGQAAPPAPLEKNDPRLIDPRPDLYKDAWLWKSLFQTCLEGPEAYLYGSLHGLRCCGMRLRLAEDGMLKLGASVELSPTESAELEKNFLDSHGRNLDNLLRRMIEGFKPAN